MPKSTNESPDFETAFHELEQLVQHLERGTSSLEEALQLYERGTLLAVRCEQLLEAATLRVRQLQESDPDTIEELDFHL